MPSHNAGYREVEQFLVKFFRETSGESYDEALTLAQLLPVNGEVIYSTSEQQLIDVYGIRGRGLYTIVQHLPNGRVCLFLVLRIQFLRINAVRFYAFRNAQFWLVCDTSLSGSCATVAFWRGATNNACVFAVTRSLLDAILFAGSFVCSCNLVE